MNGIAFTLLRYGFQPTILVVTRMETGAGGSLAVAKGQPAQTGLQPPQRPCVRQMSLMDSPTPS